MRAPLLQNLPAIVKPRLKLGWSKTHLDRLQTEIDRFLTRPPYSIIQKDDLDAGEYSISLYVDPNLSSIGLIFGDFISCLRSSLDHLACELTTARDGTRNESASFPILLRNDAKAHKSIKDQTKGIPSGAVALIKLLQPYHAGHDAKTTKLWQLHRLWNIDKHRCIPFHSTMAQIRFTYPSHIVPLSSGGDNSGIARFHLSDKPYIKFDPIIEIGIQFGDHSEGIVVSAKELLGLYEFIDNEVFPQFEHFFQIESAISRATLK